MSVADKQSEFGEPPNSFSEATFRKALKGLEIGSLAYSEVQLELKRLLAGVSRREPGRAAKDKKKATRANAGGFFCLRMPLAWCDHRLPCP